MCFSILSECLFIFLQTNCLIISCTNDGCLQILICFFLAPASVPASYRAKSRVPQKYKHETGGLGSLVVERKLNDSILFRNIVIGF